VAGDINKNVRQRREKNPLLRLSHADGRIANYRGVSVLVVERSVGRARRDSLVVLSGRQPSGGLLRWKGVNILTVVISVVKRIVLDYSYNKTNEMALISQIYFWNGTVHVSDSFSVHHQESSTVHTACK